MRKPFIMAIGKCLRILKKLRSLKNFKTIRSIRCSVAICALILSFLYCRLFKGTGVKVEVKHAL